MGAPRIFFSVAEDSADVHAATLVRAAAQHLPGARFYGLTGPRTRALGCETVADMTAHAAMLAGALGAVPRALRAVRAVAESWRSSRPDAVLLLDSPMLNMRLARAARAAGIPVLYYIAPQTWASREGRNRQIRACVDRLACILPFEESYFRGVGICAEFVGHPLSEALAEAIPDMQRAAALRAGAGAVVAALPGSRRHVIDAMLPRQVAVVQALRRGGVAVRLLVSAVDERRAGWVRPLVADDPGAAVVTGDNATMLAAADLVLVASGTATLEVAHHGRPMVVMYDAGAVMRALAPLLRFVVQTPHLSLVNILAGARVVPEFMPFIDDVTPIAQTAAQLLADAPRRALMQRQMQDVMRPLRERCASRRVCEMLREMIA